MIDAIQTSEALINKVIPLDNGPYEHGSSLIVDGKRYRYKIVPNQTTLIYSKKGRVMGTACIQFGYAWYPYGDHLIAQYILITNDEKRFLRTANISWNLPDVSPMIAAIVITATVIVIAVLTIYATQ